MNPSAIVLRTEVAGEDAAPATTDLLREIRLASVTSPHSKRNYAKAFDKLERYLAIASQPLALGSFLGLREHLLERELSPSTINVQLSAIRKLVTEAREQGIIDSETAAWLTGVEHIRQHGTPMGN